MDLNLQKHFHADQIAGDRRQDRRYTISLELRYKLIRRRRVVETGIGRTLDLSSGGIKFEADRPLPVGFNVELSIEWPAMLLNVAPMRLIVTGRILRADYSRIALRTIQHEFRTQGLQRAADAKSGARAAAQPVQFYASIPGRR